MVADGGGLISTAAVDVTVVADGWGPGVLRGGAEEGGGDDDVPPEAELEPLGSHGSHTLGAGGTAVTDAVVASHRVDSEPPHDDEADVEGVLGVSCWLTGASMGVTARAVPQAAAATPMAASNVAWRRPTWKRMCISSATEKARAWRQIPPSVSGLRIYCRDRLYTARVAKHLIDLDEDALSAARSELGTATIKDTVNEALRRATDDRRQRVRDALRELAQADLDDRAQSWR